MIIWSGWGLMVLGIVVAVFLVMNSIFGSILGLNTFADSKWMDSINLLISAVICWYTGKHINKPSGRIFIDKVTGEEFREGGGDCIKNVAFSTSKIKLLEFCNKLK